MSRPAFPRSLPEFFKMFPDEEACLKFIRESRWPEGDPMCPKCSSKICYGRKDRVGGLECAECGYTFSVTAGTVMKNTKLPLSTWLQAAYLTVTDKRGISAKQLQRDLGIRRYETAYTLLQKLRAAMVSPRRSRLHGVVEVDETLIGGPVPGKRGRGTAGPGKKAIVLGAVEVRSFVHRKSGETRTKPGRIRLRHVDDFRGKTLLGFVEGCVEPGTLVFTDDLNSYNGLGSLGYEHEVESATQGMEQEAVLPHLHLVFSNLKTWLEGTFHGSVSEKHLQGYLNEFTFRFKRRRNLYAAFQTLLSIAPSVKAPTRNELYATRQDRFPHKTPDE
jgi:transposase-like protein